MFTIQQSKDELLKNYLARFNAEMMHIERCSNGLALTAMMVGLKPSKLFWSIGKKNPKDFQELLSCTRKYANDEKFMNSRRSERLTKVGEK